MPSDAEFLGWLRFGNMARALVAWQSFGPQLTTRDRMFTTVLFLARDNAGHADEAVAMFAAPFEPPRARASGSRISCSRVSWPSVPVDNHVDRKP